MAIKISGNTVIDDSRNITSSGTMSANAYIGDGSQLTNLPGGGNVLEATASGTLSDGSTVIVNADGTVSNITQSTSHVTSSEDFVVTSLSMLNIEYDTANNKVIVVYRDDSDSNKGKAVVGTISGSTISFGSPVVFNSNLHSEPIGTVYDPNQQRVILSYRDNTNSYYGTAIVGTVSGNSISFGSPTVFNSGNTPYSDMSYDTSNNKVLLVYGDFTFGNYDGAAKVGTVSGTSISFGSETIFSTGGQHHSVATVYHPSQNRHVVIYTDGGNSQYGTAIAGTISGTSVSFGSEHVFNSGATWYPSLAYDSTSDKVVIGFIDQGNSSQGAAIVGNLSGNSFTFGTKVIFNPGTTYEKTGTSYDSINNKTVISYRDGGNTQAGTSVVGTVSGTSISFGSEIVWWGLNNGVNYVQSVFDPDSGKILIAFRTYYDGATRGKVLLFDAPGVTTTSLTTENYIGISDGAYTNGQTATIQLAGSVDDAQSGLTPGSKYYVQGDGSLSTSAGSPSVFAGTAVATTKLIVKN